MNRSWFSTSTTKILAQGNINQPIIFTSLKDDTYGGDTNNDEVGTQPYEGDWTSIQLRRSGSTFNHSVIRYGGRMGSPWWVNKGAVFIDENVETTIKNSLIEKNIYAISFSGSFTCSEIDSMIDEFVAENTVFQNNQQLSYPECP